MLRTLGEKIDPKKAALVVVDMQNDFCHPDGALGKMGQATEMMAKAAEPLRRLIAAARAAGVGVIFIQNTQNKWTKSQPFLARRVGYTESVCEENTWGADFFGVEPGPGDAVVTKHRYSAMLDTDLELLLRSRKLQTVILTGVQTNVCVESTARDAYMKDFYVVVASDCTGTTSDEEHEASLKNVERYLGTVTDSKTLIEEWSKVGAASSAG